MLHNYDNNSNNSIIINNNNNSIKNIIIKIALTCTRGVLNMEPPAEGGQDEDHAVRQPVCDEVDEEARDENDVTPTSFLSSISTKKTFSQLYKKKLDPFTYFRPQKVTTTNELSH